MSTNLNIRIDLETKKQAEALFEVLGLNMSTAVNMFLKQAIRDNGIPFTAKAYEPNVTTLSAMAENMNTAKRYHDATSMIEDITNEEV